MSAAGGAVSGADFDAVVLGSAAPVLVDFWAEWCVPCKALAPRLVALAEAHPGRLGLASVDVEAEPDLARRFDVLTLPTLILFRAGAPVARVHGAVSSRKLARVIAPHLEE